MQRKRSAWRLSGAEMQRFDLLDLLREWKIVFYDKDLIHALWVLSNQETLDALICKKYNQIQFWINPERNKIQERCWTPTIYGLHGSRSCAPKVRNSRILFHSKFTHAPWDGVWGVWEFFRCKESARGCKELQSRLQPDLKVARGHEARFCSSTSSLLVL